MKLKGSGIPTKTSKTPTALFELTDDCSPAMTNPWRSTTTSATTPWQDTGETYNYSSTKMVKVEEDVEDVEDEIDISTPSPIPNLKQSTSFDTPISPSHIEEFFNQCVTHPAFLEFRENIKRLNIDPSAAQGYGVNIASCKLSRFKWYQELKSIPDVASSLEPVCPHLDVFLKYAAYVDPEVSSALCVGIKLERMNGVLKPVYYSHVKFAPKSRYHPDLLPFMIPRINKNISAGRNGIGFETAKGATTRRVYFYYDKDQCKTGFGLSATALKCIDHVEYCELPDNTAKYVAIFDHFPAKKHSVIDTMYQPLRSPVAGIEAYVNQKYGNTLSYYGTYQRPETISLYWSMAFQSKEL